MREACKALVTLQGDKGYGMVGMGGGGGGPSTLWNEGTISEGRG